MVWRTHWIRGSAQVTQPAISGETQSAVRFARIGNRRRVHLAGRLTWRDASGTLRFASVVTRDVSERDVFVECQVPASIPLYRLVYFQLERPARETVDLPAALQQGKVLSAVYRVGPYRPATGTPHGYALRLLVEPVVKTEPAQLPLQPPRFLQYRAKPSQSRSSGDAAS
jgi:hypothetical protein